MEFKNISTLRSNMSPEQTAASDKNFQKYYSNDFGTSDAVCCSAEENGEEYLTEVCAEEFKE